MTAPNTQELRVVITTWMSENSFVQDGDPSSLPDDLDLVESGWLDSMAIIELLAHVEEVTGIEVDLSDLDAVELGTIGGICRSVLASSAS